MDVLAIINRYESILAERNIKKGDFYKACGISGAAVSQWRTGKTKPSYDTLEKIASELGVSYNYLTTGEKNPFYAGDSIDINKVTTALIKASEYWERKRIEDMLGSDEKEVLDIFRELPDDKKETALEVMRAMALASKAL